MFKRGTSTEVLGPGAVEGWVGVVSVSLRRPVMGVILGLSGQVLRMHHLQSDELGFK